MALNKVFVLLFALPKSFCLHDLLFSNDPCHFPIRASPFDNKKDARVPVEDSLDSLMDDLDSFWTQKE
jgi:hypothetical protein